MILVYLENIAEKLPKTSLSTIRAALEMKAAHGYSKTVGLLLGSAGVDAAAKEAASYGLDEIFYVQSSEFENYLAPIYSDVLIKVAEKIGATAVVGLSSSKGKDLLPRVAEKLGAAQSSDTMQILPDNQFKRPMYAGNVIATVKLNTDKKVISVRGASFDPAERVQSSSPVKAESIAPESQDAVSFVSFAATESERPELSEAEVVVSGGRALKSAENFNSLLAPLADALGAALGASRAAVDAGYAPNDWQVGQTGKVVAPKLYIAVGISGAIQHLAGMKDSKVIVAINKDAECPMMEIADYSLSGDLFQVIPDLTAAIKSIRG